MRALLAVVLVLVPASATAQELVDPPRGLSIASREIAVELRHGLALVTARVELERAGPGGPLEVGLRVPVPLGAGLAALEACSGSVCRAGVATDVANVYEAARTGRIASLDPVAIASMRGFRDRDRHVLVEAGPVVPERRFAITVRYAARAPTERGVARFELPASGPARVSLRAPGLEDATIDGEPGPREVDGAAVIRARLPAGAARASAWSVRCGEERCVRFRVAAGPVAPRARDVFVLLDASPSARAAEPVARRAALDAFLSALAPDARVTRVAFARRAVLLDEAPRAPAAIPRDEALPALGNTTAFAAAWDRIAERVRSAHDPLVVLFGDGALRADAATRAALRDAIDARVELSLVTLVDDRPVDAALAAAIEGSLGASATVLTEADRPEAERIAAPIVEAALRLDRERLAPLRAGEERVIERREEGGPVPILAAFGRRLRPATPRQLWADSLATRLHREDPRATLVAASPDQIEAARKDRDPLRGAGFARRAIHRVPRIIVCGFGCGVRVWGGVSREAFGRVRARLRPRVRACFLDARRGRPEWSGRVTLRLVVRDGELVSADVPSTTDPALASCVARVADDFEDFPDAPHTVVAHLPFVSEALAPLPPAPTPLDPRVARALDAAGL